MRIFKSKWFARFARKNGLSDAALKAAVSEIEAGNCGANLGGHVYKQRVARDGRGKRGGYRTIVIFKQGDRAFFVYGFAKSGLDNIGEKEERNLKETAIEMIGLTDEQIKARLEKGTLMEITPEV